MVRSNRPSDASRALPKPDLQAYPRPSVAVDVAVLTVVPRRAMGSDAGDSSVDQANPRDRASTARGVQADADLALVVLLLRRAASPSQGDWGLPGSFVRERERLDDAVLRTLSEKCGIEGLEPRQLHVFDDPKRDDRGWVISVAHTDVVLVDALLDARSTRDDLALAPVLAGPHTDDAPPAAMLAEPPGVSEAEPVVLDLPDGQRTLPFDHAEIVALAVGDLRDRYRTAPDPAGLAGESFTLLELRRVHEAVLGEPLQKDTFRRQMLGAITEVEGDGPRVGTVGRPARLYRRLATG
ncbi:MAG: NUDIX domain-containing protein [Aquihabitans sp.]